MTTTTGRMRPRLHFTAAQGFTNDPHGIIHHDGSYHMFFQYNPDGTVWSQHCHWGHAVSADLITWREVDVALAPEADEVGCWSGSAVVDERGPVLLYTRIVGTDWNRGEVALARTAAAMTDWRREPAESVIVGPPGDRAYVAFRDPQVRRDGDLWRAVLGAGLVGVGGCALQYSSGDLEHWEFDGVLAERDAGLRDPVWTGTVWECPQMLQVDGRWVLVVSVWDEQLYDVAYAVGDLVDDRFTAAAWGKLTHGRHLYATTTFTDAEGRPCALSWLRETDQVAPAGSPWASAMSLPHVLGLQGDRLVARQHPSLSRALPETLAIDEVPVGQGVDLGAVGSAWRVQLEIPSDGDGSVALEVTGSGATWSVRVDAAEDRIGVFSESGGSLLDVPLGLRGRASGDRSGAALDVVVDADICEITCSAGSGVGATRVPESEHSTLRLTASEALTGVRVCC